ncbi:MAG: primosomal protein N' [Paludibacteraceae bacterium]|nr:primosomal protein N' [Paludibacteraceae bacterium]
MKYVSVILPLALNRVLTYAVPDELAADVIVGGRVVVPVGKKKLYTGIVSQIFDDFDDDIEIKEIISVLDLNPVVTQSQLNLWKWIADYYICSLGEVMKAALPSGLKMESETLVAANEDFEEIEPLKKTELAVMENLSTSKQTSIEELSKLVKVKNLLPTMQSLLAKGAITLNEQLKDGYKPKMETYVTITDRLLDNEVMNKTAAELERSPKQLELLLKYLSLSSFYVKGEQKEVAKKELLAKADASPAVLQGLIKKDIFRLYDKEIGRIDNSKFANVVDRYPLTDAQNKAYDEIISNFQQKDVVLLHGVTSCGKTEIYIKLIDEAIASGKQALFLLPEIALTTQLTTRLRRVFGEQLGIYHSKFSDNERVEVWQNMLSPEKEYKVILGVRSSIFLPFRNLGIVIVDEEHENTYKQYDPAPRYHARNAAIVLAKIHNAKVLLGSATPSIESYYLATQTKKYGFVELLTRYADIQLPEINVVDVKTERLQKKMTGLFSQKLIDEMSRAIANHEQIILFQNRRGYSPYMECRSCAYVPRCIYCDVSLTLHSKDNSLVCHYCGYTIPVPQFCPSCGNPTLSNRGFGTEKAEEEISKIFPAAKVARLDLDVAKSRKNYESIISDFERGKTDILVGTQMISKGLDFEKVRVVGILSADSMLHYPDFRAHERAFQLISQVGGRAGRHGKRGLVVLQTSDVKHPVVDQVCQNSYRSMYLSQLNERTAFRYPPFYRLINLMVKGKDVDKTEAAAYELAAVLRSHFGQFVYGPDLPVVTRIQALHIRKIMVKLDVNTNVSPSKMIMKQCVDNILLHHKSVFVQIDVDPM